MAETTIRELADSGALTFGDGYRTKRGEHGTPGFRILRVADVADGRVHLDSPDFVSEEYARAIGSKLSQTGDVLLTTKGTVGRVAIYPTNAERSVYSPQLCYFRVLQPSVIDPRYLSYWFKSEAFVRQAAHRANNTDMAAYINLRDIASLTLDLPGAQEQRAIAEVLGALDDKIAANQRAVQLADELARAEFRAGLTSAQHLATTTLGTLVAEGVLELGDGYRTKRSEHADAGYRIVRAGDVTDGEVQLTGTDYVSADYEKQIGRKRVMPGDVVLTTKGTVGRVAVVPPEIEPATYSPQLCFFRVLDQARLSASYLAGWFKSDDLQAQIAVRMFKSDMAPYVNLQDIRTLEIPALDFLTQSEVGERQRVLQEFIHSAQRESDRLAAARDELLPLLMSGRIRVKDAEKSVEELL